MTKILALILSLNLFASDIECIIVNTNANIYDRSDINSIFDGYSLSKDNFLEKLKFSKKQNSRYFVNLESQNIKFWIDKKDALCTKDDDEGVFYGMSKKNSSLMTKILVATDLESLKGKKSSSSQVPIYTSFDPSSSDIRRTAKLFEIRYVYKEQNGYYLVGLADQFEADYADDIIDGWVKKDRAIMWNNRQAVEFDKSNFKRRKKAVVYYGKNLNEKLFVEGNDTKGLEYYEPRFPLLGKGETIIK